jgi:hypothetical protein
MLYDCQLSAGTRGWPQVSDEADAPLDEHEASFADALVRIIRGGWDELQSSIVEFGVATELADTRTTIRCHYLISDPNGRPRIEALARQLADQVIHYCIPRSELAKAQALPPDRSAPAVARLARDATKLFTQTQLKTGEGAELLLYMLLEKHLLIPQVLSKMSLKTSREVQYHGADGVHAKILDNGDLAVYWGEAKLYESLPEAMSDCLDSLAPYLLGNAHEQDVFLVRHFADTGDAVLTERLLDFFDDGSANSARVEMRGACLIGFDHDDYPCMPRDLAKVEDAVTAALADWHKRFRLRVKYRKLERFVIEVFFVPVPNVQQFRDAIKRELGIPIVKPKDKEQAESVTRAQKEAAS